MNGLSVDPGERRARAVHLPVDRAIEEVRGTDERLHAHVARIDEDRRRVAHAARVVTRAT